VRQLGAVRWQSERARIEALINGEQSDRYVRIGWPASGGVWVLNVSVDEAQERGASMVHSAYTMEERCRAIEKVGGVFYADPTACLDLDLA
jgi:hypothetical protein